MKHRHKIALSVAAAAVGLTLVPATSAEATIPAKYANCTNYNHYYQHGVGRVGAHDHVAAGGTPVTTWLKNTSYYNLAMHYNRGLDRDHDYIACEKR